MNRSMHTRLITQVRLPPPQLINVLTLSPSPSCVRRRQTNSQTRPVSPRIQNRKAHTRRTITSTAIDAEEGTVNVSDMSSSRPLACLPLSSLIRGYLVTSISSIPLLLRPSLTVMTFLAHTKVPLFNPDSNPLLHFLIKRTFYAQFCAGETPQEVRATSAALKEIGFKGIILGHAKEVVLSKEEEESLDSHPAAENQAQVDADEVATWRRNTIDTVELTQKGDFVALKFSGAGRQALRRLKATVACSPEFEDAVHDICKRAEQRGVGLLFDAEQASLQQGIDNWTMYFARRYNKGKAVVYGTYQAYKKRSPSNLASHLELAQKEGFILGIKLVRGAYMGSDPRDLFWATIEETHNCYNNIAKAIMQQRYQGILQPVEGGSTQFPQVSLVLATHNAESVRLANELRDEQARSGEARIELAYGQLMGMADNVSCEVVQTARTRLKSHQSSTNVEVPRAYKYLVWGRMGECMKYLLRRAHENRDAVTRTVEARRALGRELGSRMALWR